jgi:hypothetical protein
VATRGSHRQYKHPTKPGRVTIAGKRVMGEEVLVVPCEAMRALAEAELARINDVT